MHRGSGRLEPARSAIAAGVLVVVLAGALAACGGGSGSGTAPSTAPSPAATPAATSAAAQGTGLIGDVKLAVVAAVCADLKQASELVGTGLADAQAREAVVAAMGQLVKPPHPDGSLILERVMRRDVRRHRLTAAVNAGLAWCTK